MMTATAPASIWPELRDRAHDLRNLFGAIASARHMLDDHPDETRRGLLLDAIEEAALRGGALTTRMLAASPESRPECFDSAGRLRQLEPLLVTATGAGNRLVLEVPDRVVPMRAAPDRFDRIALELVANARKALAGSGTIRVRLRARRGKLVFVVADTGQGMTPARCRALLNGGAAQGPAGTGLQQARRFAREAHGQLQIRSAPGRGTTVLLELPLLEFQRD